MNQDDRPTRSTGTPPPFGATPAPQRGSAEDATRELPIVDGAAVPGRERSGGRRRLLIGLAVVLVLAAIGAFWAFAPRSDPPPDRADDVDSEPSILVTALSPNGDEESPGAGGISPSASESAEPSPSPTPPPEEDVTVASEPTLFGAWWAGDGKYAAKWEKPVDDGGSPITAYVVKDCSGGQLKTLGPNSYTVDIYIDELDCMTVQAVNAAGAGEIARFWIE